MQHHGGKCIQINKFGGSPKPPSGQNLVINYGCAESRLEFKLVSDNKLMHIDHNMCVRPANDTDGSPVSQIVKMLYESP